jgi:hypothetical protein
VVPGALLDEPAKPAWFLRLLALLPRVTIAQWRRRYRVVPDDVQSVALFRAQAQITVGKHPGVFDGGMPCGGSVRGPAAGPAFAPSRHTRSMTYGGQLIVSDTGCAPGQVTCIT